MYDFFSEFLNINYKKNYEINQCITLPSLSYRILSFSDKSEIEITVY